MSLKAIRRQIVASITKYTNHQEFDKLDPFQHYCLNQRFSPLELISRYEARWGYCRVTMHHIPSRTLLLESSAGLELCGLSLSTNAHIIRASTLMLTYWLREVGVESEVNTNQLMHQSERELFFQNYLLYHSVCSERIRQGVSRATHILTS